MSLIGIGPIITKEAFTDVPSTIPNLSLWLRSDQGIIVDDDGYVAQWQDISGNNKHCTQNTTSARPGYLTNSINNLPALSFDGGDFLEGALNVTLVNAGSFAQDQCTILLISQITANGDYGFFEACNSTNLTDTGPALRHVSSPARVFDTPGIQVAYAGNFFTPQYNIARKVSTTREIYRNATFITSGAIQDAAINTLTSYRVGKTYPALNHFLIGTIAEICFYRDAISPANITLLNNYVAARYSIP